MLVTVCIVIGLFCLLGTCFFLFRRFYPGKSMCGLLLMCATNYGPIERTYCVCAGSDFECGSRDPNQSEYL